MFLSVTFMKTMKSSEQLIAEHPMLAVGSAFAIGALAGWVASGKARGGAIGAASGALSGLVVALLRDALLDRLGGYAKSWIDDNERQASYEPEVESFAEH